jgi:hypothetical protein
VFNLKNWEMVSFADMGKTAGKTSLRRKKIKHSSASNRSNLKS